MKLNCSFNEAKKVTCCGMLSTTIACMYLCNTKESIEYNCVYFIFLGQTVNVYTMLIE